MLGTYPCLSQGSLGQGLMVVLKVVCWAVMFIWFDVLHACVSCISAEAARFLPGDSLLPVYTLGLFQKLSYTLELGPGPSAGTIGSMTSHSLRKL